MKQIHQMATSVPGFSFLLFKNNEGKINKTFYKISKSYY